MKQRVKIDSAILSLTIIVLALVCQSHKWYETNRYVDNLLDFLGVMSILNGTYIRMASRGYKKNFSESGKELVMTGPYALVRNPMYFGTFLIGAGFVLILWPWWILPIFAGLFYLRFQRQILKEETHLEKMFGKAYESYKKEVPAIFPTFKRLRKLKVKQIFLWKEAWNTKEKRGLFVWPVLALTLETIKEKFFIGSRDFPETIFIFLLAAILFAVGLWWEYVKG